MPPRMIVPVLQGRPMEGRRERWFFKFTSPASRTVTIYFNPSPTATFGDLLPQISLDLFGSKDESGVQIIDKKQNKLVPPNIPLSEALFAKYGYGVGTEFAVRVVPPLMSRMSTNQYDIDDDDKNNYGAAERQRQMERNLLASENNSNMGQGYSFYDEEDEDEEDEDENSDGDEDGSLDNTDMFILFYRAGLL